MTHARVKTGGSIEDTTDHKLSLDAEVTAERGGSTYFFLHDVSSASPNPALPLDALIPFTGQWWRMPGKEGTSPVSVSPDPGLLAAQSQVITVTADKGINSIRGKRAYMYDIAVDPVRLLAYLKTMAKTNSQPFDEAAMKADLQTYTAIGKLWVDADSFDMERIEWDIRRVQDDKETLTATLHIDFTLHDSAPPIDVPATSRVFGAPPTGSAALLPVPSQSGGDDPTLLDVMQKAQQKAQKAASVSSF
jgi:hypothetical protein